SISERHWTRNRSGENQNYFRAFLTDKQPGSSRHWAWTLHCKNDGGRTSRKDLGRIETGVGQYVSLYSSAPYRGKGNRKRDCVNRANQSLQQSSTLRMPGRTVYQITKCWWLSIASCSPLTGLELVASQRF